MREKDTSPRMSSREAFPADGSSGFGLPTCPPSRHDRVMTVASWAFVPFTAAGQRGFFTPLPLIHLHYETTVKTTSFVSPLWEKGPGGFDTP